MYITINEGTLSSYNMNLITWNVCKNVKNE